MYFRDSQAEVLFTTNEKTLETKSRVSDDKKKYVLYIYTCVWHHKNYVISPKIK